MRKPIAILLFFLIFLVSCASPTLQPVETITPMPTFTSTATLPPTPTNTPLPTETFTPFPTATPGPYWHTPFGEFPHAVNDNKQETFNFLEDPAKFLRVPNLKPSTILAYHESLKKIKLSDGSPLLKPMNTPEFTSLRPLNWSISDYPFRDILYIGDWNEGDPLNPRARYVGGFIYTFPGTKQNWFTGEFVGVTMQVEDRSQPEGYALWTAIDTKARFEGMRKAIMNSASQFSPELNIEQGDPNSEWWDMRELLRTEGWNDPVQNDQAFQDYLAGIRNDYLDSHITLASTPATRWILPKK